jgi:uncharacterized membrane protein
MSRRALAWTAAVTVVAVALAVTFAVTGWPWPIYLGVVGAIVVYAWVAWMLDDLEGRHAIDEDDWVAYVIDEMERDLAHGDEDTAPSQPAPAQPAAAPRPRGVLRRVVVWLRQIDWSDDRGHGPPITSAGQRRHQQL